MIYRKIEAKSGIHIFNFKELFTYREVLYSLIKRSITIRYSDTILGSTYTILLPIFNMVIYTFLFGYVARVSTGDMPYSIFAYTGLILWGFFQLGLSGAVPSLVINANIITKIYFPRIFFPLTPCAISFVDYVISLGILIGLLFIFGIIPSSKIFLIPVVIIPTFLLAFGVGSFLAALNVIYKDIQYLSQPLLQILMYTSPVVYPVTLVPEKFQWLLMFNPLTGLLDAHRSFILEGYAMNYSVYILSVVISVIVAIMGYLYFTKIERTFADII